MSTQQYKNFKGLKREIRQVAKRGGRIVGNARRELEVETGVPVITAQNAAQLNQVVTQMIGGIVETNDKKDN